jgi:hypothetical protein
VTGVGTITTRPSTFAAYNSCFYVAAGRGTASVASGATAFLGSDVWREALSKMAGSGWEFHFTDLCHLKMELRLREEVVKAAFAIRGLRWTGGTTLDTAAGADLSTKLNALFASPGSYSTNSCGQGMAVVYQRALQQLFGAAFQTSFGTYELHGTTVNVPLGTLHSSWPWAGSRTRRDDEWLPGDNIYLSNRRVHIDDQGNKYDLLDWQAFENGSPRRPGPLPENALQENAIYIFDSRLYGHDYGVVKNMHLHYANSVNVGFFDTHRLYNEHHGRFTD